MSHVVVAVLGAAIAHFGPPNTWDTQMVARWVRARTDEIYGKAPRVERDWTEPRQQAEFTPLAFTPRVPADEREALQSEEGFR